MTSAEIPGGAGEPAPKRLKLSPPPASRSPSNTNSTTANPNNDVNTSSGDPDIDVIMKPHDLDFMEDTTSVEQRREIQSGILCFVSESTTGFAGILKQRYTDFLVNEITPDGKVGHLTNTKARKPPGTKVHEKVTTAILSEVAQEQTPQNEQSSGANLSSLPASTSPEAKSLPTQSDTTTSEPVDSGNISELKTSVSAEDIALLDSLIGSDIRETVLRMYERILSQPSAKPSIFGFLHTRPVHDKDIRTQIHKEFRRIFASRFETVVSDDGSISIRGASRQQQQPRGGGLQPGDSRNSRQQTKGKLGWMELGGEFLHFSLYKENKDTMEVLGFLSSKLKMKPGSFGFAGTKDRRAVTVQRVSTYRMRAETLANFNKELRGSMVGNFTYEKYGLNLGDLAGNEFHITLRDVTIDDPKFEHLELEEKLFMAKEVVGNAVKNLQQNGFINYFGLQRFGSYEVGTDDVGKKILQGDFKAAVDGILYIRPEIMEAILSNRESTLPKDEINRARAIRLFKNTGRSQKALELLPRKFAGEKIVMLHLDQRTKEADFIGALLRIPRNLKLMYVHAYQSLVWNMVASQRWARYGNQVVKGDLVLINPKEDKNGGADEKQEEVDESGEVIVRPDALDSAVTHEDAFERARPLSDEEAKSGKYTIYDIVLSTPGFDIEYPDNEIGEFYRDFMQSERGGGLHPGQMRRQQKDFSLSGSYRKLMATIGKDCSYEVRSYDDEQQQLVETDLEKICKLDPTHPTGKWNLSAQNGQNGQPQSSDNKIKRDIGDGKNLEASRKAADTIDHEKKRKTDENPNTDEKAKRAEIHNAWKNLPSVLRAEDKAAAAERDTQDKAYAENPESRKLIQPTFKETYIQTAPDNFSRTGHRETAVIGKPTEVTESKDETETTAILVKPHVDVQQTAIVESQARQSAGVKRTREESPEIDTIPVIEAVPGKVLADLKDTLQPGFPKIAAVIKFQLGSSQYATMALRELMKRGGVKTYKPEYSTAR